MRDLLISLAGLLLGPVAWRASRRREEIYGFLDGFVLVGVAGLILCEVLPETLRETYGETGPLALVLAAAGFALPFALERKLALLPFSPNAFFRWLMILGLLLHQLIDGVALSRRLLESSESLRLAVILHQIPKGFFIWGMVGVAIGARAGIGVMAGLCITTAGGFFLGDRLADVLREQAALWLFQAFVGGGLLHVILHHVPRHAAGLLCSDSGCSVGEPGPSARPRMFLWSGLGAIASLAGLVVLAQRHPESPGEAAGAADRFLPGFTDLVLETAPWILLGFVAAGVFQAFLPKVIAAWFRGRGRVSQALRGIAIGVPLPLCSCGVVPVYLSLLKKSVPPAAALAFLIATPEIGIDSVFLSGSLLGVEITLIRLAMAFLIALSVGLTLARTFEKIEGAGELDRYSIPQERPPPATFAARLREAARFGGREVVDHTGAWLLVGLASAALLNTYVRPEDLQAVPRGLDILLLSLLGLPLYVCASGATPLAAVLLHKGLSTGAVLAFLITGPSTNVTTFGILKRYHGLKGAVLFAVSVYGFSIAAGILVNYLFPDPTPPIARMLEHAEHGLLEWASAAALAALFAASLLRLGPRGFLSTLGEGLSGASMRPSRDHPDSHDHENHDAPIAGDPRPHAAPVPR